MSKMNTIGLMLGVFAMSYESGLHTWDEPTKEDGKNYKARLAQAEIENNKANGLKEFFYGENSLYALNRKNADKKARSKHWL